MVLRKLAKKCGQKQTEHLNSLRAGFHLSLLIRSPPGVERKGVKMLNLTERRARFVYEGARLAAQIANAPIIPDCWHDREEPFKKQFCNVIERQCGEQRSTSPEELHGSWMQSYFAMGWVYGEKYDREKKIHPDLVPYADLGQLEKDKDSVFVALCEIARQWIY